MFSKYTAEMLEEFSQAKKNNKIEVRYSDFDKIRNISKNDMISARKDIQEEIKRIDALKAPDGKTDLPQAEKDAKKAEWIRLQDSMDALEKSWTSGTLQIEKHREERRDEVVQLTRKQLATLFDVVSVPPSTLTPAAIDPFPVVSAPAPVPAITTTPVDIDAPQAPVPTPTPVARARVAHRTSVARVVPTVSTSRVHRAEVKNSDDQTLAQNKKFIKDNTLEDTYKPLKDSLIPSLLKNPTKENIKNLQNLVGLTDKENDGVFGKNTQNKLENYMKERNSTPVTQAPERVDPIVESSPDVIEIKKEAIRFIDEKIIKNDAVFRRFKGDKNSFVQDPFSVMSTLNHSFMGQPGLLTGSLLGDLQIKGSQGFLSENVIQSKELLKSWREKMTPSQKESIVKELNAEWRKKAQAKIDSQVE